jgi:hypothetical protein
MYFKKYINSSYLLSTFSNTNYRSVNSGNDEKYPINETNNEVEIYNIYKNHENKKLLDILENDKISINTKLNLLQDNTIKSINLTAGGLMDDFNFTIS